MARFILRRLGAAVILILVLSAVIFVLQAISPGDPVKAYLGANASPAAIAQQREALGLNDPLYLQYLRFLGNLVQGDLGLSLRTHRSVVTDLAAFLPATVELVATSFLLAVTLAVLFAVSGALRWPGTAVFRGPLLVLATAPPFLLALGGIVLFYAQLHWLPASGRGTDASSPTGRPCRRRHRDRAPHPPGARACHCTVNCDGAHPPVEPREHSEVRLRSHSGVQGLGASDGA
jgi:peptide/nickel transport system permease protein